MSDQLELLDGVPVQPDTRITVRQRFALELIGRLQPVSNDELGAHLHQERRDRGGRGHATDTRCNYCADEGSQMGRALRAKGLVKQRRGQGWLLTGSLSAPSNEEAKPEDPFPIGY